VNEDDLDDGMDFSEESDISISEMVCIDQAEGKMISPTQKLIDLLKMTPRFLHIKTDSQNDFLDEIMALNLTDCIQCEVKNETNHSGLCFNEIGDQIQNEEGEGSRI
jgi:hypothetical protein